MSVSVGVATWASCDATDMQRIQRHAAQKALGPLDWGHWRTLVPSRPLRWSFPHSIASPALDDLIAGFCGPVALHRAYFVPYPFNPALAPGFPPQRSFWWDELTGDQTRERVLVIDGGWAFDSWRGATDSGYAEWARAAAAAFTGALSPPPSQQLYHVLEIALLDCLRIGLAEQLPVVVTLG